MSTLRLFSSIDRCRQSTTIGTVYIYILYFSRQLPPESPKRGVVNEEVDDVCSIVAPSHQHPNRAFGDERFSPPTSMSPFSETANKTASLPRNTSTRRLSTFPPSLAVSGRLEVR